MRVLLSLLAGSLLFGQEGITSATKPSIRAHGSASVSLKPDQVRIDIGVTTQAGTAQAAASANAKKVSDVIAELKKVVGSNGEIQTSDYSLHPNYTRPKEREAPVISGYTANNTVRVVYDNVDEAGKLIDAATKVGANAIQGIQFTLKDESVARAQALSEASQNARKSAEAMAKSLGLKVVRVMRVEDSAPPTVYPVREAMMMRADAAATPVEAGSVRVQANVMVTLEVAQ
jgi:uncharacterized protein YggE